MRHSFLDKYSNVSSPVHKMDPVMKLLAALLIILAIVSQPPDNLMPFAIYGILLLLLVSLSKIPVVFVMKRVLIILPFVVFAAAFYPISVKLSDRSIDLSFHHPAVLKGISIFLKAVLSVMVLIILVSTERFHQLLGALRRLKMPAAVCITSALMYRYIFILADESMKTSLARQSRTPGKIKQDRLKVLGNQMAVIFIRSWERAKMIYNSMLSRGFTGDFPNGDRKKMRTGHLLTLFILGLLLAVIRFMDPIHAFIINVLF
ncbi:MAG: cobalt ECF transporter T component CbiQ [Bacteroidales bacterium]